MFLLTAHSKSSIAEHAGACALIEAALLETWESFSRAMYWYKHNEPELTRQHMTEYYLHTKLTYALNETLCANMDIYSALHDQRRYESEMPS